MSVRDEYARQESELDELYSEIILDHYRNPRHRGSLEAPTAAHEGLNPLCGDEVTVELLVDGTASLTSPTRARAARSASRRRR